MLHNDLSSPWPACASPCWSTQVADLQSLHSVHARAKVKIYVPVAKLWLRCESGSRKQATWGPAAMVRLHSAGLVPGADIMGLETASLGGVQCTLCLSRSQVLA
jgi:hypothetical protein